MCADRQWIGGRNNSLNVSKLKKMFNSQTVNMNTHKNVVRFYTTPFNEVSWLCKIVG